MIRAFHQHVHDELQQLRIAGLYKPERVITTPHGAVIGTAAGHEVINLCANNYLGLSTYPAVIDAARDALRTHGYGLISVRFICGTQDLHKTSEARLSAFLGDRANHGLRRAPGAAAGRASAGTGRLCRRL